MHTIVLIVAGGRGTRCVSSVPKQYAHLGGQPVLRHTIKAFLTHPAIEAVQVVIHPEDVVLYEGAVKGLKLLPPVFGGSSRQESVRKGLEALELAAPDYVLIHDAARPFLSKSLIDRVVTGLASNAAVIPVLPMAETIKEVQEEKVIRTHDRSVLFHAQTPQGFHYQTILSLHKRFIGRELTDDAALCEEAGVEVVTVAGEKQNIKITWKEDMQENIEWETRSGIGFDAHKFKEPVAGKEPYVMLCGVKIPHPFMLEAHSDGDVALHALVDAMLGTIGAGDIGMHFPPSDPRWKGADSSQFVTYTHDLIKEKQGAIINVDITIIGEAPKVGPVREVMKQRVAEILGIDPSRVSVKATTTEKMGFTGRKEGIAAQAIASIRFPI